MTTVQDATLEFLRSVGADTLFGNPGSTELGLLNKWPSDIRYVLGLHEASVVGMADGYARATGKAAFVNLHSAAGVGHALGNVYTAFRNRTPMVIIAGQQSRELLPHQPFLGATEAPQFPRPYVKFSIEPARPEDVPAAIAQAYRMAMQRPWGPTFVSVPADDWAVPCKLLPQRHVSADTAPDPDLIKSAAQTISKARQLAFVVGTEVDEEGVGPELVKLAEQAGAAVYTAPFAARITFPENHPQFAGFLPASPTKVSDTLTQYDVVVVIGAPVFTYHVPGTSALADGKVQIIQLTCDPTTAAVAVAGDSIVGSLKHGIPALASQIEVSNRTVSVARAPIQEPKAGKTISPAVLVHRLGQQMSPDMVLVEEAPSIRPIMQEYIRLNEWGSFFTMSSGGLGYSLPAAVGHALARPERTTVCLIGDGSFMYSPQAVWTAAQHNLNVCFVVVNNSGYGAMRSFRQVLQVDEIPGIELSGLDFPSLVKGMGCKAKRVSTVAELDEALKATLAERGPRLLEVEIDSEVQELY